MGAINGILMGVYAVVNICFGQKYENRKKKSTENCHFYSREKALYMAWACFRNG